MKIRNEIKVGVVVLVAIGLLYFGLNYLKGSDIFNESDIYYAQYEKVDGLGRDDAVVLNGFRVGKVKQVDLKPGESNRILVTIEITEEDLKLPYGSVAQIISQDLLGSKAVNLNLTLDSLYHEPGDTLNSALEEALKSVLEERLKPLEKRINLLLEETRDLISTARIAITPVKSTIETIERTAISVDTLVSMHNQKLSAVLTNIESVTANLSANNEHINEILANLSTISDSLTRANFAAAVENASNALAGLDSVLAQVNRGEGSLGLLIRDEKLYNNLEQASLELEKLVEDLRVNPERYVHVSLFGRKAEENKPKKKERKEE